jgi:hypothetical protein
VKAVTGTRACSTELIHDRAEVEAGRSRDRRIFAKRLDHLSRRLSSLPRRETSTLLTHWKLFKGCHVLGHQFVKWNEHIHSPEQPIRIIGGVLRAEWDADKDGSPDANAPKFLNTENPDWEGNYKVKYWHQQWQEIILKEVQQIVAQGFDGVYLDIIDGFEFFEYDATSDDWIDDRPNPETGNTFREDMVQWVSKIRKALSVDGRPSWVIPQNGEALVELQGYLDIIDAIGAEDVFITGKRPQKQSEVKYRMGFLRKASDASKPVYVIEYPRNKRAKTAAINGAQAAGFSLLLTDRPLKTLGESSHP